VPQVILSRQVNQTSGNLQLAFSGFCHSLFINCQSHYSRTVLPCQGEYAPRFGVASFKIGGVDQTPPRGSLKSNFNHIWFSGVDHEWHGHFKRQTLDQAAHHIGFVAAFGNRDTDIQGVRAKIHLVLSDLEHAVVILSQQQAFESPGALSVEPFANHKWCGLLLDRDCLDRRSQRSESLMFVFWWGNVSDFLAESHNVGGRGAAATANNADAITADVICQGSRKLLCLHRIDGFAIHVHRQAGVRDARDGQLGVFAQV